jgi:phage shock protein C
MTNGVKNMDRKLYRSRSDRIIGGVASGLADYFEIDPIIIRIAFVVAALGWGVSILAYILLWVIVPEEPLDWQKTPPEDLSVETDYINKVFSDRQKRKQNRKVLAGVILILIGTIWFMSNIFSFINFHYLWPMVLIILGIIIMLKVPLFHRRHEQFYNNQNNK